MWDALLQSILTGPTVVHLRLWFKPVFLIAAIDEMDAHGINVTDQVNLYPDAIRQTYIAIVPPSLRDRAAQRWLLPFSHLSTDRAWQFSLHEEPLLEKPLTLSNINHPSFRVFVPTDMRSAWASPERRRDLRQALLTRMAKDEDADCKLIVRHLGFISDGRQTTTQTEPRPPVEKVEHDGKLSRLGYGGPPESEEHLRLKEYVKAHPDEFGAPYGCSAETEKLLESKDEIDVLFKVPNELLAVELNLFAHTT